MKQTSWNFGYLGWCDLWGFSMRMLSIVCGLFLLFTSHSAIAECPFAKTLEGDEGIVCTVISCSPDQQCWECQRTGEDKSCGTLCYVRGAGWLENGCATQVLFPTYANSQSKLELAVEYWAVASWGHLTCAQESGPSGCLERGNPRTPTYWAKYFAPFQPVSTRPI